VRSSDGRAAGGSRNVQSSQANEFNFNVKVEGEGGEEAGRRLVRGAESEVEDSGVMASLTEFFRSGEE